MVVLPQTDKSVPASAAARMLPFPPASATPVDDYVFLLGRPPIAEFLGFVRNMAADGPSAEQGPLTEQWRAANDRVRALEAAEGGLADNPETFPLPDEAAALADQVRTDPMFSSSYRFVPSEFVMVDLDRLVVFQKFINLGYVAALEASLPAQPTVEDMARLAFGVDRRNAPVRTMQNAQNAFSFISSSNDLRFLDAKLVQVGPGDKLPCGGRAVARVMLTVGFGSNYLNAISVQGRLVLNNGSHRAYALRDLGVRYAPCIVQRVTRAEELELITGGDLQQSPERYLSTPRPPMLKDYFDPALRATVAVPRKNRLVTLKFGCEQSDVPATA